MAEKVGLQAILDLQNWSKNVTKYTGDLSKMDKASSGFGSKVGSHFAGVGKAIAGVGVAIGAAAAAASVAVGAFVVSGISKAADLEAQMSSIAAVLNTTAEGVKPLKDLIMDLALDPNLVVTTNEAADAIENLAKNGLTMDQIMAGAAKSTVLLANATGADFGMAADIASDTMAIFNIKAEDMATAVDGITGVTNASKFTIQDYALAMAQSGAVASASGVSFDDFNATIAAISPMFASGSDAGTSFKTFLQNGLIPQTDKAKEMMLGLGLITADGTNAFYNANGSMKDMSEVAVILNGALGDLSEQQASVALDTMFGTDASRAAIGLLRSGEVVYKTAAEAVKALGVSYDEAAAMAEGGITKFEAMQLAIAQIDAEEQAATRMKNFRGVLQILQGAIEALQIKIGDVFLPILTKLGEMANKLITAYGPALVKPFEDFGAALTTFFGEIEKGTAPMDAFALALDGMGVDGDAVATSLKGIWDGITLVVGVIGTALQPIGDFILKFVEWKDVLIVAAGAVATIVVPAIWALAAPLLGVGLTLGGAILAVAALRTAWESDFANIRTITTNAFTAIQTAFTPLTEALKTNGAAALTEIQAFATGNKTEFANVKLIWFAAKLSAQNLFSGIVDYATTNLPTWTAKLGEWSTAAGAWLATASATVGTQLSAWYQSLSSELALKLELWKTAFALWVPEAWAWLTKAGTEATTYVSEWYTALSGAVTTKLETWKTALTPWIAETWAWLVKASGDAVNQVGLWYTALSGAITTKLETWKTAFDLWVPEAWAWLVKASSDASTQIGLWYTALTTEMAPKLEAWKLTLGEWTTAAWNWLAEAVPLATTELGTWVTTITNFVKDNFPQWQAKLATWGGALWQWIVDALPTVGEKATEFTGLLNEKVDEGFKEFEKKSATWTAEAMALRSVVLTVEPSVLRLTGALHDFSVEMQALDFTELNKGVGGLGGTFTGMWDIVKPIVGFIQTITFVRTILWTNQLAASVKGLPGIFQIAADGIGLALQAINAAWKGTFDFVKGIITLDFPAALDGLKRTFTNAMFFIETIVFTAALIVKAGFLIIKDAIINTLEDVGILDAARNIWTAIQTIWNAAKDPLIAVWTTIVDGIKKQILNPAKSWISMGQDIIADLRDGIGDMIGAVTTKIGEVAKVIVDAIKALPAKMLQIGKDIVGGLIDGIKAKWGELKSTVEGLVDTLPQGVQDLLGIGSPSKVFMQIGYEIVRGWIMGLENESSRLFKTVEWLASAVVKTATKAGAGAGAALASSMSNWQKLGGARLDEVGKDTPSGLQFTKQSDLLKQQQNLVDLVKTIGDVGGDVGSMLSRFIQGNQLVVSAEAQVDLATRMMDTLARRLNRTLYLAATGFTQQAQRVEATATEALDGFGDTAKQKVAELTQAIYNPDASAGSSQQALRNLGEFATALERIKKEIAFFQNRRVSAQSVIEAIVGSDVSKLDQFKLGIAGIDTQIADLQKRLMETGDTSLLGDLRKLDSQRAGMINDLQSFVLTVEQLKQGVAEMAKHRPSVDAVMKSMSGDESKVEQFKNIVAGLDAQIATLQTRMVETGDRSLLNELGVLDLKRSGALDDLRNYITTVERLEIEFANLEAFRPDIENIINKQDVTRLDQFKDGIAEIDEKIAAMQKTILETGDTSLLGNLRGLDAQRGRMVVDLQTFIQQTEALNRELADLQKRRPSFEDILVPPAQIGQLDEYQMALANIDEQIGRLEERIKTTGDRGLLARLAGLDQQRTQVISRINVYTDSLKALDRQLEFLAKQRFDADTIIDDLTSEFDQIEHFKNGIAALDEQIATMEERIKASGDWSLVPGLQTLDAKRSLITSDLRSFLMQAKQAERAVEGFGETAQAHMQAILQNIYATPAFGNRTNALRDFNNFVNQLFSIRSQLDRRAPKLDVGGLIDRASSQFDQMTSFEQMIGSIDSQAEQLQNRILETGDQGLLSQLFGMDAQRARLEGDLQRFIVQFSNMEDQMRRIKTVGQAGQTSIEAFISEQIEPIQDAFDKPMRAEERDAWLITMQNRVYAVNRFIDQMRVVEKMQQSIEGKSGFENLSDEFATLQDINIPESTRLALMRNVQAFIEQSRAVEDLQQSVINVPGFDTLADEFATLQDFDVPESARLNLQRIVQSYIAQIKQFQAAQRDVSIGAGADPLAGRFKTERLDAIEAKLRDINTTEAERGQLIAQYRMEQEKILAIQQKQQQLTFLQEQLSLLEKLRSIDDEEDYAINVQNILGGIKFGIGASMDDLLALTGRTIDELVKFTNWKLGIHSPSRVFAEIGAYMMQGLGQGIERMAMVPMRSMAMAVSNVAQSPLINRSVNINMGGVTVANGMDETMFRAMIRQEVGMML